IEFGDVRQRISFDVAKNNFYNTARYGLDSQINWLEGRCRPAAKLIIEELLPLARHGLKSVAVDETDIDRTLGIIGERVTERKSGAAWMLGSLAHMDARAKNNVKMRTITAAMKTNQENRTPLHKWKL